MKTTNMPKGLPDNQIDGNFASKNSPAQSGIFITVLLFFTIAGTLVNSNLFVHQTLASYFLFVIFSSIVIVYLGANLAFTSESWHIPLSIPTLILLLWCAYVLLHPFLIASEYNSRYTYFILCALFYLSVSLFLVNKTLSIRWLFRCIALLAMFEAVYCILQYIGIVSSFNGYFKATGTQVNPNVTAIFMAMALPALWLSILEEKKLLKKVAIAGLIITIAALLTLKCRTAYIGASVSSAIFLNAHFKWIQLLLNKRNRIFGVAMLLLAIGFILPLATKVNHAKQASTDGRVTIWKITKQMIAEKPLFGCGYGLFERNYNLQQAKYFEYEKSEPQEKVNASHAHMAYNDVLESMVEGGIVGAVLFWGFIAAILLCFRKVKEKSPYAKAAFAGIVALILMSFVNFTILAVPVMCLLMVYAACIPNDQVVFSGIIKNTGTLKVIRFGVGTIFMVSALYAGYHHIQYGLGHLKLKMTVTKLNQNESIIAVQMLEPMEKTMEKSGTYLWKYSKALSAIKQYPQALEKFKLAILLTSDPDLYLDIGQCYTRLGQFNEAEKSYRTAMYMQPNLFKPRFMLMQLYQQNTDTANVLVMAQSIAQMKPKVPSREVGQYKAEARKILISANKHTDKNVKKLPFPVAIPLPKSLPKRGGT